MKKTKNPLCSSKRTVCCFGKGIPLNLLTLIQGSSILSGTQSGRQLANRLGLCSHSGLPVRAETVSTCWVFTLISFVLNLILAFFVVDSSRKEIVAGTKATFLAFRLRNTKVILIAVLRVIHIRCYCREYCCTIYFMIATMNIVLSLTVLFCVEIIAIFQYSLSYSQFSCS